MLDITQITTSPNGVPVFNASPWYPSYPIANAVTPTPISPYSVLNIPAYWRAMNFLSTNLASFGRSVHKDGAKRTADEPAHPLERLLKRRPNACQNATIFWRTLFFHAAHRGNGFAEIVREGAGQPAGLRNLSPDEVSPFRYEFTADEKRELRRSGLIIDDTRGAQQFYLDRLSKRVLLGADVIHLQALGYDGMSGMDPTALHSETFQRAATIGRYQTKYLQKGTVIRGSVEIPHTASEEQVKDIVSTIRTFFTGPDAERDVMVLSDGAKLNNKTLTPRESQLVEQGAYVTKQIAQITGVPPQFLYEFEDSKYNDAIEAMGQDVVRYTFRPWIEQTEDELTTKLLSSDDQEDGFAVKLNPDALLRGDTEAVNKSATTTVNAGLRTKNEGRKLIGLPPDPDPDSDKLKVRGDTSPGGASAPGAPPARVHQRAAATPADEPEQASAAATRPLNGYHVTAALDVVKQFKANEISQAVAVELLVAVGIPRDRAEAMVATGPAPGQLDATQSKPSRPVTADSTNGPPRPDAYAAMGPVLAAACERVDRRTDKAFADNEKRTDAGRVPYFNAFAESQAKFTAETLAPVVDALGALGAAELPDVARVAERYAAAVRKRAATGEVVALRSLIGG
jgi:HK97 family phage portal protein